MQGSQKSKRVSWPSEANLCQVRLFLSEESPSQVGVGAQDHLQAKKILSGLHLNGLVSDDNLPPGFEAFNPASQLKNKLAQIPVVKWRRPPRFMVDAAWQVVSGEESKEVEIQNQRELRVLEAIYPRESAIPPNPALTPDIEGAAVHDDRRVPLIPITPIEEEDPSADPSSDCTASISTSTSSPSLPSHGAFPPSQFTSPNFGSGRTASGIGGNDQDILKAALTAVAKSNEQIDHELLVNILSNPTILERLVRHQGTTSSGSQCIAPNPQTAPPKPQPSGAPLYKMDPPSHPPPQFNKVEIGSSSSPMISNGLLYPYPNSSGPMPPPQLSVSPLPPSLPGVPPQMPSLQSGMKDLNYYKNLIHQHGGERQGEPPLPSFASTHPIHHPSINQDGTDNSKPRDAKRKIMKPCIYFNSSKGCRHGANCVYQHDLSFQQQPSNIPEMQTAKRMKMDREVRGGSQSYT